jgi:FAD:protein FMN transferase
MNDKKKRLLSTIFSSICICFLIASIIYLTIYDKSIDGSSSSGFAFGTFYKMDVYGGDYNLALKEISTTIETIENELSTSKETSTLYKLNNSKSNIEFVISPTFYDLFVKTKEIYELSGGVLNPALFKIVKLWNLSPDKINNILGQNVDSIPTNEDINAVKDCCKLEYFEVYESGDKRYIKKTNDDSMLDFGAELKGYTVDLLKDILKKHNCKSGLLNIGGNLYCYGNKIDGKNYKIAINNPRKNSEDCLYFASLELSNLSAVTSGDYERYYFYNNVRYCHIIDSETFSPIQNGTIASTIVGEDSFICDCFATIAMVKGDKFKEFIETYNSDNNKNYRFVRLSQKEDGLYYQNYNLDINIIDKNFKVEL